MLKVHALLVQPELTNPLPDLPFSREQEGDGLSKQYVVLVPKLRLGNGCKRGEVSPGLGNEVENL
ncbi:MAG: hypothetical protein B6245_05055 [Desulfobacteraceae bacterium 4572_88]|nr:MAG: hypothetical protein B6245_05055 [Desulfobacteraceae bacterium 4572_88]